MKFSEGWLREWVDPPVDTAALCEQLTMAGLEVEAVTAVAPEFERVVVGEVIALEPHPNADRLRVCQVAVGGPEPLQIVCGAANVHAGARVPTALVGAKLPGGLEIKSARLRGVPSEGMLCSAKELGLAESAEGLLLFPADAPVGADVRAYLQLDDAAIELKLTPNRGDCLSVAGVAREVAALTGTTVTVRAIEPVAAVTEDRHAVQVAVPTDCPRYVGRVIRGIDPSAPSPLWLRERLRRSGLRSLGPLVDVTNYVLLELGQPMHAFDLARLSGAITVRQSWAGEAITLLDGRELALGAGALVIADDTGPIALAGIMGGAATAVGKETTDVFLESAYFAPLTVAGKARAYGLHTDSSHRFERGVDPMLQRRAMERATALLVAIAGGEPGPVIEIVSEAHLPGRGAIELRAASIERILGLAVPPADVESILRRLGMQVETAGEGCWRVVPPGFRFDVVLEVDLIEEIARVYGYGRITSTVPVASLDIRPVLESQAGSDELRRVLTARGYYEAITYSFVDPRLQRLLDPQIEAIALANPISADMSVMRTNVWPGLMQALQYNLNRQQTRVRFFESGLIYKQQGAELKQVSVMGGVAFGPVLPEQWGARAGSVDFFDVKADLESLFALIGAGAEFSFAAETHPALHPRQSARVYRGGQPIGWLGVLSPDVTVAADLPAAPVVFELELAALQAARLPVFHEVSRFPAIRRDLAIVLDDAVSAGAVCDRVRAVAGPLLQDLVLFDMYKGKGIDSGKKSLALALTLQDFSRTLTDSDVEAVVRRVTTALGESFGARLRD